jgi:programmed cell death 6-interacting protein
MTNQLSIPFKTTYVVPLTETVYNHIRSKNRNVHPDAFKWDLNKWEALRKAAANSSVHVNQVETILEYVLDLHKFLDSDHRPNDSYWRYHAQLAFILTKLPANVWMFAVFFHASP